MIFIHRILRVRHGPCAWKPQACARSESIEPAEIDCKCFRDIVKYLHNRVHSYVWVVLLKLYSNLTLVFSPSSDNLVVAEYIPTNWLRENSMSSGKRFKFYYRKSQAKRRCKSWQTMNVRSSVCNQNRSWICLILSLSFNFSSLSLIFTHK